MSQSFFDAAFRALTGHGPFPWQRQFFKRLAAGDTPPVCDIPTGLGKTAVIAAWLIALAYALRSKGIRASIPRRLVYVVNRRTVVDQATDEAQRLRSRLKGKHVPKDMMSVVEELRELLARLSAISHTEPVAISTLRGELADNGEWKLDPARPAIIIGTVDMIGSRLLFSGYGDGRYWRPHHAGLLGQDTLIVHDEAHLTPAFSAILRSIFNEQQREHSRDMNGPAIHRPVRFVELSATTTPKTTSSNMEEELLRLTDEDYADPIVDERIHAVKQLGRHTVNNSKDLVPRIVELAKAHKSGRIIVFVQSPENAKVICDSLKNDKTLKGRVELLTGTLRGHERNRLTETNVFRWFRGNTDGIEDFVSSGPACLVCTSAGEVGVDIDADNMVSDLSTLESMIQRLGRVNRRGGKGRIATVDIVADQSLLEGGKNEDERRAATWNALSRLPAAADGSLDASPMALRALAGFEEAWSLQPGIPRATDILFDSWALTSILPPKPEVAIWLHGIKESPDPPETVVAWRTEVVKLKKLNVDEETLDRIFEVFPMRAVERLRERTDRVHKELQKIAKRLASQKSKKESEETPAILVRRDRASWTTLEALVTDKEQLDNFLIVLPTEVGGLKDGYLDGSSAVPAEDVAEWDAPAMQKRQRVWVRGEVTEAMMGGNVEEDLVTRMRVALDDDSADPTEADYGVLEYRTAARDPDAALGASESRGPVGLRDHTEGVLAHVRAIAQSLKIDSLEEVFSIAAEWHDRGKNRPLWQTAAGNRDLASPVAKSGKRGFKSRLLEGYRHELGTLLEAVRDPRICRHPERDLILHLMGAHHSWARPHFEPDAADPNYGGEENHETMIEAMRRFSRLQQRFGRWTLAWLESLFRCADGLASAGIPAKQERQ